MEIIPFRRRVRPLEQGGAMRPRRPPVPPDRWEPRGFRFAWKLYLVASILAALLVMGGEIGIFSPQYLDLPWLQTPQQRKQFDLVIGGEAMRGRVVDGDTLATSSAHIRLHGIDAPELGQPCRIAGAELDCGRRAAEILTRFVAGARIHCGERGADQRGRTLAICVRADNRDLGRHMVANGWAMAYRRYSHAYVADEDAARRDRLGIWAGDVEMPEEWRRRTR